MARQVPLTEVAVGQTVSVVEILGGHGIHHRLSALGIRPGAMLTKVSGSFGGFGPTVVRCGETQTALGAGVCRRVVVEAP